MLKDTEFMFASSRIRAAEGKGTARERLEHLLESRDTAALAAAAAEWTGADAGRSLDALLDDALADAVALVREAVPDLSVFHFLLYKYDCCNVKIAIKNQVGHLSLDSLYFHTGSVSPEVVAAMPASRDFHALPTHMAAAAEEAMDTFAKTGEARCIDLLLDSACFLDCSEAALATGVPLFRELTALRADCVNLLSSLRISRLKMPRETAAALMRRAFVPGGDLPADAFLNGEGELAPLEQLADRVTVPGLRDAVLFAADPKTTAAAAEHRFDDVYDRKCAAYRYKPFGPEIPALFLLGREAEIRNARLIAAGLAGGLSRDQIREKVRVCYV